ncbi:cytochrome c553 [Undibacterium sp. GrIS 1.8]
MAFVFRFASAIKLSSSMTLPLFTSDLLIKRLKASALLPRLPALVTLSVVCLLFSQAAMAQAVPDTLSQRLMACTSCHGKQGRAANDGYYPRIAGKPEGYLFNQLKNFKDGKRTYPVMTYMVGNMSDAYLQEIATFFSDQHPPYPAPQQLDIPAASIERGRQLVQHGDTQKKIPACVSCHGEKMTGVAPFIPGLLGLPRDYINGQLGAWQTGSRHAQAPDCMEQIAQKLSPQDVSAVSAWLASQALPADPLPIAAKDMTASLPMRCGSVPLMGAK